MSAALPDPLVSTEWLAAHLGEPDLKVVDATFYLPHLKRDAAAEFEQAHVPGAVFFDVETIADHANPLPHMLPDAKAFADAMGALGIAAGDRVVAYGGRGLIASARAWWTFRVFGHDRVAVLDGGSAKWKKEGRPVEAGRASPAARRFAASLPARSWSRTSTGCGPSWSGATRRWWTRARGGASRPPSPRSGRACGAATSRAAAACRTTSCSAPTTTLMLPAEDVGAAFARAGLDPARPVVASCGSGVSAAVLALGLYRLGRRDAAVYDGSWTEWGGRADTPVATGEA